MTDRDLIAEGRARHSAFVQSPSTDRAFDFAEWAGLEVPALLDALEAAYQAIDVVQAAHESQLTRMAKERARLQRKLEAAQRPPVGYRDIADTLAFLAVKTTEGNYDIATDAAFRRELTDRFEDLLNRLPEGTITEGREDPQ